MENLIFKNECYLIVGICMKIHRLLGRGFKETVYKDALEIELRKAQIPFEKERKFRIEYEGEVLRHTFDADFVVFESIIVEVKAAAATPSDAFRQTLNYLKSSSLKLAILINFGTDKLTFQRIVCTY